jgi:hypothetical protein
MLDRAVLGSRTNGNLSDEIIAQTMHLVAALAPSRKA